MAYGAPDIPACSLAESNFGSQVSSGPLQEDLGRFFFFLGRERKKKWTKKEPNSPSSAQACYSKRERRTHPLL